MSIDHKKDLRSIAIPLGVGSAYHYIYIKEHVDKNKSSNDKNKTVFIGNVDYGHLRSHSDLNGFLNNIFKYFGKIESITISQYDTDGKSFSTSNQGCEGYLPEIAFDELEGHIDSSFFSSFPRKSNFAHLTFSKRSSLISALSAHDSVYFDVMKEVESMWGISSLCTPKTAKQIRDSYGFKAITLILISFLNN